jgi:hypothetical protein
MAKQECTAFCYTWDTVLAEDFNSCVKQIEAGAGNDTSMYGDCGYTDYKTLGSTSATGTDVGDGDEQACCEDRLLQFDIDGVIHVVILVIVRSLLTVTIQMI